MRKIIITLLIALPTISFGQLGISFHQSNLPFIGLNYQIKNKIRPELRVGTDNYFDAISVEGIITYDILKKEDYEFYAGLGVRTNDFTGLVIPIGLNVYPLSTKQFGFHIELSPIVGDDNILRGSWGIRYRFKSKQ
ncbi:MAG: hypothetical protein JWP69_159 [Flaviaesturariibacter sp.]|jgi:hypothetical protein|nr:hypothetical protein [Flaviaesturariibacter sp.]